MTKQLQISLAAARVNANMTQGEVAKKIGKTKQSVVNWEKGRVVPDIPTLNYLAKIYGVSIDEIFLPKKST